MAYLCSSLKQQMQKQNERVFQFYRIWKRIHIPCAYRYMYWDNTYVKIVIVNWKISSVPMQLSYHINLSARLRKIRNCGSVID